MRTTEPWQHVRREQLPQPTKRLLMAQSGEQIQAKGADGVRLAKHYLEGTGRAQVIWDNPTAGVNKLQYEKAAGGTYSFDCGGNLEGGEKKGLTFVAEVKYYHTLSDLTRLFTEFLAKCYRTLDYQPKVADHFMWITWNPHAATNWKELATPASLKKAVLTDQVTKDIALGEAEIKDSICSAVAAALIIVVLSDKQLEMLSLTKRERLHMRKALMELREGE